MNPISSTESAEQKFRQLLEEFFISRYDEKSLPSHGLYHHRRVWGYAKELLNTGLFNQGGSKLPEKLLIASYLHDIGMSVEKGLLHGRHSRELCIDFLSCNGLNTDNYHDVLEAIENHDKKDYSEDEKSSELLRMLSLADDMDAFGFTGIYRYAEIYVTRGIKPEIIGYIIKENASKRFKNFEKAVRLNQKFLQKQEDRYQLLDIFFSKYNNQAPSYKFGSADLYGHCGIIELIIRSLNDNFELKNFNASCHYPEDQVIIWFFEGLKKEML
jgi:HD superfamily phosphodiesterase